jgi:type I restriction enzyme M protein
MSRKKNKQAENTIPAGYTLDYVSGRQIKETKKELVRQRVVRALIHEYGFSPEDMELDFSIGGRKKVDVAIFHHGKEHTIENLGRAVLCRQEPNVGKNAVRIRDFEQAAKDLDEIETIMREVDAVQYGLWTNGLEFFFVERNRSASKPSAPHRRLADGRRDGRPPSGHLRCPYPHRRQRDAQDHLPPVPQLHPWQRGMPKDAAFCSSYLIFCKMHDENLRGKQRQAWKRRFWAGRRSSSSHRAARPFVPVSRSYLHRGQEA